MAITNNPIDLVVDKDLKINSSIENLYIINFYIQEKAEFKENNSYFVLKEKSTNNIILRAEIKPKSLKLSINHNPITLEIVEDLNFPSHRLRLCATCINPTNNNSITRSIFEGEFSLKELLKKFDRYYIQDIYLIIY